MRWNRTSCDSSSTSLRRQCALAMALAAALGPLALAAAIVFLQSPHIQSVSEAPRAASDAKKSEYTWTKPISVTQETDSNSVSCNARGQSEGNGR